MIQVKYVAHRGFLCHVQVSWRTFLYDYCHLLILPSEQVATLVQKCPLGHCWALGSTGRGMSCLMQHHRIGCCCKSDGSWLSKGCRTRCPGWPSSAAGSSLAGWQAKIHNFFPLFCASAFVSPCVGEILWQARCALREFWDWELCSTPQDHSEHAGGPWSLTWHPWTMFWVSQGWDGLSSPLQENPSPWESSGVTLIAHAQAGLFARQCRAPQAKLCFATWIWPHWPRELK